jgi:hypothetical protein
MSLMHSFPIMVNQSYSCYLLLLTENSDMAQTTPRDIPGLPNANKLRTDKQKIPIV